MQKLQVESKNTPRDAQLVSCSVNSGLNREETLSDRSTRLACNNSEVDHLQCRGGSDSRVRNVVYVLNRRGVPLMPTTQAKSRHLLKGGRATVVKRFPFTIQLTTATGENRQTLTLGVDTGYKTIGLSVTSTKKELFSAEIELRSNVVKLLSERLMYRRGKRNKLWYRKPRFANRTATKKEGWLAPSITHRLSSHVNLIDRIHKFLPVTKIKVETAAFDIQKIQNPDIEGIGYQNGVQKDFENVRAYVLYRDNHTCQHCKKTNVILHTHHLESRQTGSDRPENLLTLCDVCHKKLHAGKIKLSLKPSKRFRTETFMSIMRKNLLRILTSKYPDINETFGYETKSKRRVLGLEKSHADDAFMISAGTDQTRSFRHTIKQKRRNNRCLQLNRKGFRPSIRRQRYKIQPQDLVTVKGIEYTAVGVFNKGKYVKVKDNSGKIINLNVLKIDHIFNTCGFVWN